MTDKEEGQVVVGDAGEGEPEDRQADAEPADAAGPQDDAESAADRLEALQDEVDDLTDRLARALAEQDNLRKRADRRVEQARRAGRGGLLLELLPGLEDLDRALSDPAPDREGLRIVRDELWRVLGRLGLEPIDAEGERFDPDRHEAVARVETGEAPEGRVVDVVERGYVLDDRVLRPSKVTVARAPAASSNEEE